jgi:hypothetical protein
MNKRTYAPRNRRCQATKKRCRKYARVRVGCVGTTVIYRYCKAHADWAIYYILGAYRVKRITADAKARE